jgi:hypothetical protein
LGNFVGLSRQIVSTISVSRQANLPLTHSAANWRSLAPPLAEPELGQRKIMEISDDEMFTIFHPFAADKCKETKQSGRKFVHYCSAEAAYHIIKSNRIRLRNAAAMNDFMEIEHGMDCLTAARSDEAGYRLKCLIDKMFPNISGKLANLYDRWEPNFRSDTYIACLSEHDEDENDLGRLSALSLFGACPRSFTAFHSSIIPRRTSWAPNCRNS